MDVAGFVGRVSGRRLRRRRQPSKKVTNVAGDAGGEVVAWIGREERGFVRARAAAAAQGRWVGFGGVVVGGGV